MIRRTGLLLGLLLVTGCAPLVPAPHPPAVTDRLGQPLRQFRLEGRISVKTEEEAFSGGIRWSHDNARDEILLSSPLGQGVAELRREGGAVSLTDAEGRLHEAESGEALLREVLGVSLPLEGLVHWLGAQPRPSTPYDLERDSEGHVSRLEQDGWRLEYGRYQVHEGRWLPGRIFARRGELLEFRLVVDSWQAL